MACAHHWLIGTPSGPTSTGRCKRCGEEREFVNGEDRLRRASKAEWGQVAVYRRAEGVVSATIRKLNSGEGALPLTHYEGSHNA